MIVEIIVTVFLLVALFEIALAVYFVRRTLLRTQTDIERTLDMAGTSWEEYIPQIQSDREWIWQQVHERLTILSNDGLKLIGNFFPVKNARGTVICLHGYTSNSVRDYTSLAKYYLENNFQLLLVDHRAHGESEGKYIGFGVLERYDSLKWIEYLNERFGCEQKILVHGTSMGAATTLMMTGLKLPENVCGVVADCGFTSPWDVFKSVLKNTYHLPAFPLLHLTSLIARMTAGYDYTECSATEEVKKSTVPILLIHGSADTFVPTCMCEEIYKNCPDGEMQIIEGAGHAESYYKNPQLYQEKLQEHFVKCGL
jgi:fermentation-respiration switch protein FrsA (DUF1100 family)